MISADILRKKVLDKAIRGELVDNNPNEKAVDVKEIKDNVPFEVPDNWKWVKLENVCRLNNGIKMSNYKSLPYLEVAYLRNKKEPVYKKSGVIANNLDLAILVDGENSGEVFLIKEEGFLGSTLKLLEISNNCNYKYVKKFLKYYQDILKNNKTGSAIPHLDKKRFKKLLIPLPPLEEQKRIVAKIEELFKLMDIKEKNDIKLNSYKEKLKGKVLNEAIRGKLVEQDSNEQPIDIEDIKDNVPFVIPSNWKWVRFSSILKVTSGNFLSKSEKKNIGEYPIYGGNGITGYYKDYNVSEKTIIIGRVGYYCGNIHLTSQKAWITDNALIASFLISEYNVEYMFYILNYIGLRENKNSTAQPVISANKIKNILIPLPPLREQKRIVSKIEQLFNFIDKLEC